MFAINVSMSSFMLAIALTYSWSLSLSYSMNSEISSSLSEMIFRHSSFCKLISCERYALKIAYLVEFLAVLLLLEFLPIPVDFNVLFMRRYDLGLNFIRSLLSRLVFLRASVRLIFVGVAPDLFNRHHRLVLLEHEFFCRVNTSLTYFWTH